NAQNPLEEGQADNRSSSSSKGDNLGENNRSLAIVSSPYSEENKGRGNYKSIGSHKKIDPRSHYNASSALAPPSSEVISYSAYAKDLADRQPSAISDNSFSPITQILPNQTRLAEGSPRQRQIPANSPNKSAVLSNEVNDAVNSSVKESTSSSSIEEKAERIMCKLGFFPGVIERQAVIDFLNGKLTSQKAVDCIASNQLIDKNKIKKGLEEAKELLKNESSSPLEHKKEDDIVISKQEYEELIVKARLAEVERFIMVEFSIILGIDEKRIAEIEIEALSLLFTSDSGFYKYLFKADPEHEYYEKYTCVGKSFNMKRESAFSDWDRAKSGSEKDWIKEVISRYYNADEIEKVEIIKQLQREEKAYEEEEKLGWHWLINNGGKLIGLNIFNRRLLPECCDLKYTNIEEDAKNYQGLKGIEQGRENVKQMLWLFVGRDKKIPEVFLITNWEKNERQGYQSLLEEIGGGDIMRIAEFFQDVKEVSDIMAKQHLLARIDPLTGLYNQKYFREQLIKEIREALRYPGRQVSLIMLDIDFFKNVNDTYGHLAGDEVLKKIAEILKESSRELDAVVRYGGEEFILILPRTELSKAVEIAERIRKEIKSSEILFGNQVIKVAVSLGVSEFVSPCLFSEEKIMVRVEEGIKMSIEGELETRLEEVREYSKEKMESLFEKAERFLKGQGYEGVEEYIKKEKESFKNKKARLGEGVKKYLNQEVKGHLEEKMRKEIEEEVRKYSEEAKKQLIEATDGVLYLAKVTGRDRTIVYDGVADPERMNEQREKIKDLKKGIIETKNIAKGKQLQHVEKSFCEKEEPLEERLNEHIKSLKNISVSSPADSQHLAGINSALTQQLNNPNNSTNPISPISSSPFSPFGQMDAELPFFPIGPPDSIIGSVRDNRFHRNEQIRLGLRERLKAQGILPDKRSVELIKRVSLMLAMLERGIIVTFASNSPPDFSYILEVSFINIEGKSEEAKNDKANKKQRIRDGNKESGDPVYNRGIIIEKKGNYPTGSRTGKPARDIYPYGSFKRAERTSGKLDLGNRQNNHPVIIESDQNPRRLKSYYYEISYFIWAAVQNSLIQFGSDSSPPSSLAFSPSTMLRTDGERSQTISFQHSAFSEYKPSLISSLPIYNTIKPLSWATVPARRSASSWLMALRHAGVAALEVANSIFEGPDVASQLNDSGALEKYKNYEVAEGLYVASPLQGAFPATLNTRYEIQDTRYEQKQGGAKWISYQLLTINHQLNWNSAISSLTEKGLSLLQHGMKATKFITSLSISLPGESLSKLTAISSQLKEKGQRLFAKMLNIGTEFSPPTASPTLISANYASRYPLSAIRYLKERAPAYAKKQFAKTDLAPAGRRGGALEGTRYKMQDVGLREVDFSVAGSPILNPYLNNLLEEEGKLR
ncbi:MAG: diguanylate cyclase, partial [Candidatus Omnitrophica bacterium]|nr:diguanylate cyclase [Candidatus Omnitrophota bacterium]